jgi:D-tyrosyl-tRNA(Tyr) deacylase
MRTVVQRVLRAEVRSGGATVARIGPGLFLLVGVAKGDAEADADSTARKVAALRVFAGRTPMDRTVSDAGGACLVVSQFTLAGSITKGNRPSFDGAEAPTRAESCDRGGRSSDVRG